MKIGIFGGTFNPVHNGHLINAQFALEECGLERVIFMPARVPVHKEISDEVSPDERCVMIEMAIRDNERFYISRYEIEKSVPAYTIDTVSELKKEYPDDELAVIIGADSYDQLDTWKEYERLLSIVEIIVLRRLNSVADGSKYSTLSHRIFFAGNPIIEISSSMIRSLIRSGRNYRYLVPEPVREHISEKRYYQT